MDELPAWNRGLFIRTLHIRSPWLHEKRERVQSAKFSVQSGREEDVVSVSAQQTESRRSIEGPVDLCEVGMDLVWLLYAHDRFGHLEVRNGGSEQLRNGDSAGENRLVPAALSLATGIGPAIISGAGPARTVALYLHNRLNSLSDRIEGVSLSKLRRTKLNRFIKRLLAEYAAIIHRQRQINHHCERCIFMYFFYGAFTLVFPILLLFEDHSEYFLILFNLASYLSVVFAVLWPPILFNSYFTQAASLSSFVSSTELKSAIF